jgi:uncharacterized protein YfaS (alpha-2-macroglobulin family)
MTIFCSASSRLLRSAILTAVAITSVLLTVCIRAQQVTAIYRHGSIQVTIPYHSPNAGSGRLVTEILDPENSALDRVERTTSIDKGDGVWQEVITLEKPMAFEDLVWQRVRYKFAFDDPGMPALEGTEAISQILRRPVLHVLGQTTYIAGSHAAIRVIVFDATSNNPLTGSLRIELASPDQRTHTLFTGSINRRGTLEAAFRLPEGLAGNYTMRLVVDTPIGTTEYTEPVQLHEESSVLLTTEKPIYQPGQTIHIRALALNKAGHQADVGRKLTFEIEDSRGNKVFRKVTVTDKFGIASGEFTLADEVNLGPYHLRALMGDRNSPSDTSEITLQVDRYVLPKFKVAIEFTRRDGKEQRDFRPGDHVAGTVHANYFFGKPVDNAPVTIKATGMDVTTFEAGRAEGKTDKDGAYRFDLKLPSYFAGKPLSQGAARALIEATVTDSAAHAESRGEPVTISEFPLLITAIPEGGTLIPNLDNEVFIISSYPDGTPAPTSLTVHVPDRIATIGEPPRNQSLSTDASGVAIYRIDPGATIDALQITADDHKGKHATTTVSFQMRSGGDQVLLRTDQGVFRIGARIHLNVYSTRPHGTAYIDLVKNNQTILTKDLDLHGGEGELNITATPEMAGTLDIDAYLFGRDAQPVADHRLVFVQPAEELKIAATTDASIYKPGSEARIRFRVTNSHGEGVQAAVGLQIVDEAVFALAEKQPGFAKVFFYLEQELMKPRYEIHSLSMEDTIGRDESESRNANGTTVRALFAATELAMPAKLDVEYGRTLPQEKFDEYQNRYQAAFSDQVRQIAATLSRQLADHPEKITKAFAAMAPRDAWNTPMRIEPAHWYTGRSHYYLIRSAGADRQFSTNDDLTAYIQARTGMVLHSPGTGGTFDVRLEHDRGPMNGLAEIHGIVTDPSGAVIPRAIITVRQFSLAATRTTHSDAEGAFDFAGLTPGSYRIQVSSPGFVSLSNQITLLPRDRAITSITLSVGAVSQTVAVAALNAVVMDGPAPAPMAGAIGGPVMQAARESRGEFAAMKVLQFDELVDKKQKEELAATGSGDAPHVRSYFPEALYINPEIVTDGKGNASISVPVADSITTWRLAMLASTQSGAIGSGTASLKVFQDFFVDLDLPVTLTQGDRVSIPIAIYNYSGNAGDVSLKLQPEDWFSSDDNALEKTAQVDAGRVGGSQFTIEAKRIGKFNLTLSAHLDGNESRNDIVVREIEVIPNGREQNLVFNGRLESSVQHTLAFPTDAIPDATSIRVRLYPGPLSQVIEGMDSILSMPGGCFEQTSSSTYPNVLALDYMKHTNKLTPEIHAKAEGYIANGYQRLLTFEVPGGGFSWFGQAPANKILTAYGLMEFSDMSKVSDVDPRLIERTAAWLASQQQPDGSWKPDTYFINEGATTRYNSDLLRITAYIAWSLANTSYKGVAVEKARRYIDQHSGSSTDPYTLAVVANFAVDYAKDRDFTRNAMQAIIDVRTEKGDQVSWTTGETGVYSTGESAAIETTGLATQALLKWGQASEITRKALNYISAHKGASGAWGTTQATIMVLRSLVLATQLSASDVRGSLAVSLDGKTVETLNLTEDNNDLLHQFVLKGIDPAAADEVQLKFDGSGSLAYQVVGRYFIPWEKQPDRAALSIDVAYDRTELSRNDIATATATIHNNLPALAKMVMVDLGIPPGFDLLSEDLQSLQDKTHDDASGRLEKFSLTATQAILYFNALAPDQTVKVAFRLRAKYPIRAHTFSSRVYEYYNPAISSTARPVELQVVDRTN